MTGMSPNPSVPRATVFGMSLARSDALDHVDMTWDAPPRFRIKSRLAPEVPRVRESEIKSEYRRATNPGWLFSLTSNGRTALRLE